MPSSKHTPCAPSSMRTRRPRRPRHDPLVAALCLLGAVVPLVAGCAPFPPAEAPFDPGQSVAQGGSASKTKHQVTRGSITGSIRAAGRLAPATETELSFPVSGRMRAVHVAAGAQVKPGDLLAELDPGPLRRQAEDAELSHSVALLRLEQARLKRVSDQDVLIARTALERAESDLRRAGERLAAVQAGPVPADLRAAELEVRSTELARDDAVARLAVARRGPNAEDVAAAGATVERARLALAAAEADLAASASLAQRGLASETVALANARTEYEKARLAYQARVEPTPTPRPLVDPVQVRTLEAEVMAAEGAVERARRDHTAAEFEQVPPRNPATPAVPNRIPEAKHAMQKADVDLEVARRRLDLARAGKLPPETEVPQPRSAAEVAAEQGAAKAEMDQAKRALDQAEAAAAAVAQRGNGLSPPEVAVADARLAHQVAQEALGRLRAGTPAEELAQLERAVALAQAAHETATAALASLRQPTQRELRDAQETVDHARADLQLARAEYADRQSQLPSRRTELALDVKVLELEAEVESRQVVAAREALEGTRLVAPIEGTVIAVEKKNLDSVAAGEMVLLLADMADVLVTANVTEAEAEALSAGQPATVVLPAPLDRRLPATIADVGSTPLLQDGGGAIRVTLHLQELAPGLQPNQANEVHFEGITRDSAVLLPVGAVRTVGSRRSVLIADRDRDREVEIRTGLVSADDTLVEVVAGLREGDTVILPPESG